MDRSYRDSLICGASPLFMGVAIFLLWLVTRWNWLMLAGILNIYGGLVFFLSGAVCLVKFHLRSLITWDIPRRRLWVLTTFGAALLCSNFPVAFGIINAVVRITTRYAVVIQNTSTDPLDDVQVFGGGCKEDIGVIPPSVVVERYFWVEADGQLEFRATTAGVVHTKVIDDYVTHGMGGRATVVFNQDHTISSQVDRGSD
jgi:hypothetical protein